LSLSSFQAFCPRLSLAVALKQRNDVQFQNELGVSQL
jgi:hypothetical protein